MSDMSIEVQGRDIVVRRAASDFSVTYRWLGDEPMLIAVTSMRRDPRPDELAFLAQAWKAAYAKAKELGWL
jgi:hypothetical protein